MRRLNAQKGILFAALTAVLFSMLEPVSKLVADSVSPFVITVIRFIAGALFLAPFALAEQKKHPRPLRRKEYAMVFLTGIIMVCISMPLLQLSIQASDSPALIAIVFSANSLFTILLSATLLREPFRSVQITSAALCVAGIVICAMPLESAHLASVGIALLAALTFSLYTILTKKYLSEVSSTVSLTLSFFFGGITLLLILLCNGTDMQFEWEPRSVLCMLVLGIIVTGGGYYAYFRAMEFGGAYSAAFAFFIKPVLAPFMAFLIGGSLPTANVFIAIPFIVSGSIINAYSGRKRACAPASKLPAGSDMSDAA